MSNPIPYGDAPVAARITSPGRAIVAAQVSVTQTEFPATVHVGDVTALNPDQNPTVANSGTSESAILDFGIPKAWNIVANSTTTLEPGSDATVTRSEQGGNILLDFGIPKGEKGDTGEAGADATAIYGDPVTVAHGGTGKADGTRLAYFADCSCATTDNSTTCTGEIEGYSHAIGNVIVAKIDRIPANAHPATLVITSGGETVAEYALKMGAPLNGALFNLSGDTTLRRNMAMEFVVTADGVATAIQQPWMPTQLICTNNPVASFSSPDQYENLTVAGSLTGNYTKEQYAISNACTNLVSNMAGKVDAIRQKYFDIVIRKGSLWLRYCDTTTPASITNGGHITLSQSPLRNVFSDLREVNKFTRSMRFIGTLTYTDVATDSAMSQTFELAEGGEEQIGSTTATLSLSLVTSNLESRITLNDPDGALADAKITKYWAFPISDAVTEITEQAEGISIRRDGPWCMCVLDATIALDVLTTETTFAIPRGMLPDEPVSAWAVCSDGHMVELRAEATSTNAGTLTVRLSPNTTDANGNLRASIMWHCAKPVI